MKVTLIAIFACLAASAMADIYMHNPRGSNNRVDDNNNAPANRLFDSQNNNQAGYNPNPDDTMEYYVGSQLTVQWTSQHGCGVNPNTACDMIIQYRCDELMRDGTSRQQPEDPPANGDEPSADRGRHEPYVNWQECDVRDRNGGLFIADQNVGNQASSTRQNGGGNRSGYECAEERDYYPYWHPSYWKDIAIMTSNTTRCLYYQAESQNVMAKNACSDPVYNNEDDCTQNGGTWDLVPAWGIEEPDCVLAPWGRVNIHGDAVNPEGGIGGNMEHAYYNMTMPNEVSDACTIRVRYNTSSYDYDGWNEIDARYNDELSPVENDPVVTVAGMDLELNINTAQFFRTFQDRSNIFKIVERPAEVDDNAPIYNLNVRGKRGNNAATYPNVEYDFTPTRMHIEENAYVHWQWTGSNNNPQGTDRSNAVPAEEEGLAYPLHADEDPGLFQTLEQRQMAGSSCGSEDPNLQDVEPYCNVGLVQYPEKGTFHYLSTKNNAYTNRAQKGTIIVGEGTGSNAGTIVGLSIAGVVVLGGGAGAAVMMKKRGGAGASRF